MNIKDVVLQFLIIDEQEKMGVMPMLNSHAAMRNHVDSLSPEDAQKLKRKFRKCETISESTVFINFTCLFFYL